MEEFFFKRGGIVRLTMKADKAVGDTVNSQVSSENERNRCPLSRQAIPHRARITFNLRVRVIHRASANPFDIFRVLSHPDMTQMGLRFISVMTAQEP
jgi:hypothetical protein